ncbi:TRAP transporter substrate-binding protein [Rhodopseudomonas sp. P2A-2r]|uniref:TRAP transporter substrate-binding protein n=1 Tax=unclassified Rhodopseudomonas TaxID=2638247 RepID=UPI0022348718|nr:TRAP transporter substrate-binding protein [Rhodopseudomonas sp. P2A-2r]UZE46818.1 TRAP transporter substrate-binding protein [Rhodopseudomonas sp. P2A-2r]
MLSRRRLLITAGLAVTCPAVLRAESLKLRLAHGLPTTHPVHPAMQRFADIVRERTGGEIEIAIFADGQLGQEVDLLSQVQAGKLDFLKVSASLLERFHPAYKVLNLPFTLRDRAHWLKVTTSDVGRDILASTAPAGLVGVTFYDAGARSFYGRKPINHPDDLKGMKIRIQPSETMTRLMQVFGAEGVELAWSNVFIALKSGLVDGAENSVAALIIGNHADVVSHYSFDEHTMISDVLLIGSARLQSLSPQHQSVVREAAMASYDHMNTLWTDFETRAKTEIAQRGVTFVRPDKTPFIEKAAPLIEQFAADEVSRSVLRRIAQS